MSNGPRRAAGRRGVLERLARRHGVAASYRNADDQIVSASDDTLVGVLSALGVPIANPDEASSLLAERPAAQASPQVLVAWDGILTPSTSAAVGRLVLEGGEEADFAATRARLPYGVHELQRPDGDVTVISAPRRLELGDSGRGWGVIAPAYALVDERHRPAGDLESLRRLGELVGTFGGSVVATLPLLADLATADGGPPGQAPYGPLSRLWWNEAYLDLTRLPELHGGTAEFPDSMDGERADLAAIATAQRPALALAAEALDSQDSPRRRAFRSFCAERPDLGRYASFRAAIEAAGPDRSRWPDSWRDGYIPDGAVDPEAVRRHTYAQWAVDDQLAADAAALADHGVGYLLDLPVGCRRGGYDPWAHRNGFCDTATIGAPPDTFFEGGQDWRLAPPHPEGDRKGGYPLFRSCLAHQLRHARALRIDHVMAWSRLWWIPEGMSPTQGAYVSYATEELLAAAILEAWRYGARLVGENLGTVEPSFTAQLHDHAVAGMSVAIFELEVDPARPIRPHRTSAAYLDTHDTPTFTAFLTGADLDTRQRLGLMDEAHGKAAADHRRRVVGELTRRLIASGRLEDGADPAAVIGALLQELGESESELVIASLEDLLGVLVSQNIPGTDRPENFSRRYDRSLEAIGADPSVGELLARLASARRATSKAPASEVRS